MTNGVRGFETRGEIILNTEQLTSTWKANADVINLRRPRDAAEHDELIALIERLLELSAPDPTQSPYSMLLDTAMTYASDWEDSNVEMPQSDPVNVVRALMESHGLRQTDLVQAGVIDQPSLSRVLRGERSISKSMAVQLAGYFKVSASIFLMP
jgi:HTH-type transcriptional regulator/antitoxin HigA